MKAHNLFSVIICMLLANMAWSQVKPPLTFEKKTHDFGTIKEDGGVVSTRFYFKNTSTSAAKIINIAVSCGCTSPTWPKEEIAPQDTGSVLITFDPMDRPHHFEKPIRVEFQKGADVVLKIHGEVSPRPEGPRDWYPFFVGDLWFKHSNMFVGSVYNDASTTFGNVIYNPTDKPITVDWNKSSIPNNFLSIDASGTQVIAPKDSAAFTITYDATAKHDWGYVNDTLLLMTDDATMPKKVITASALIKERFDENAPQAQIKSDKDDYTFEDAEYGSEMDVSFTITNTGEAPLYIRKINSNCDCVSAKAPQEPIAPGASIPLTVHVNTGNHMGWMRKMLTLITNDPKAEFKHLIIKGEVKAPKRSND